MTEQEQQDQKIDAILEEIEAQHGLHHPLEDVFNMELGGAPLTPQDSYDSIANIQAQLPATATVEQTTPPVDLKDDDDLATDKRIDEVYHAAMATFNEQTAYTQIIEPRYAARNAEVAAQFLGLALNAATAKAKIKVDRKRTNAAFIPFGNGSTKANVVADRNDILSMFSIDGEVKEIK